MGKKKKPNKDRAVKETLLESGLSSMQHLGTKMGGTVGAPGGAEIPWTVRKEVTCPPMFQSRRATGLDERGEGADRGLAMTTDRLRAKGGKRVCSPAQNMQGIPREGQAEVKCR